MTIRPGSQSTSFRTGSLPSTLRASICCVTAIDPSSAAMPEPTRPVTIRAVSTGPSSRTMEMQTRRPT
jgi:hypothetical protein